MLDESTALGIGHLVAKYLSGHGYPFQTRYSRNLQQYTLDLDNGGICIRIVVECTGKGIFATGILADDSGWGEERFFYQKSETIPVDFHSPDSLPEVLRLIKVFKGEE